MSSPNLSLSPSPPLSPLPLAGHNAGDPDQAIEELQDPPSAPLANSTANMDGDSDLSDAMSELSDVDEAQFEDFDPNQITIEEQPIAVDEDNVKLLGRHKRKRDGENDGEAGKKKKKEGRREKPKKKKERKDSDDDFSGGQEVEGKRVRKRKAFVEGEGRPRKEKIRTVRNATPEDEEALDPEERELSWFEADHRMGAD